LHCINRCNWTRAHHPAAATNRRLPKSRLQTRSIADTSSSNATSTSHRHTHQSILHRIHPQHLYQIINDVDKYNQFLPYCNESKVLQNSPCGTMYDAVLRVGLPGLLPSLSMSSSSLLEERYISRVRMISPADDDGDASKLMWAVEAKSIQSQLFDSLKSRWQLTFVENDVRSNNNSSEGSDNMMHSNNTSCNVNFEVEIQVSNPLIGFTLDKVLEDVAKKQVEAFERRCNEVPFSTTI